MSDGDGWAFEYVANIVNAARMLVAVQVFLSRTVGKECFTPGLHSTINRGNLFVLFLFSSVLCSGVKPLLLIYNKLVFASVPIVYMYVLWNLLVS